MKKMMCILMAALLLAGCSGQQDQLDRAMTLRAELIASPVTFEAEINADYGDKNYSFCMECRAETDGTMTFSVTKPETIAGITGTLSGEGGELTFDKTALAFGLMADGQISPVAAPWVLMKTLRSGYLTSCTQEDDGLRVAIDDSYEEDALHLDIWLDDRDLPKTAEIYWQGRRLLTVQVTNFTFG